MRSPKLPGTHWAGGVSAPRSRNSAEAGGYGRAPCASSAHAKNRRRSAAGQGAGRISAGARHGEGNLDAAYGWMSQEQLNSVRGAPVWGLLFVFTGDLHLKSRCQGCMRQHARSRSRSRDDALWFPERFRLPSAHRAHQLTGRPQAALDPEPWVKAGWQTHRQLAHRAPHGAEGFPRGQKCLSKERSSSLMTQHTASIQKGL